MPGPAYLERRPRLREPLELAPLERGRVCARAPSDGTTLELGADEASVVALLAGRYDVRELLSAAAALDPPVPALVTLALVRKLDARGLLADLDEPGRAFTWVPPVTPASRRRRSKLARALDARIRVPALAALFAPARRLPRGWIVPASFGAIGALALELAFAAVSARARPLLDPFASRADSAPRVAFVAWLVVSLALSWRGLLRGVALASLGHAVPAVQLALGFGFPHLEVDDAARRTAPRRDRQALSLVGLGALAAFAAAPAAFALFAGARGAAAIAAIACLLFFVDLAPHGRSDAYTLIAITAGVPRHARRSAAYLLRRSLRNLLWRAPMGERERVFTAVTSAWLVHAISAEVWLAAVLVPGARGLFERTLAHDGGRPTASALLAIAMLFATLATFVVVMVALATGAMGMIVFALRDRGVSAPASDAAVEPTDADVRARLAEPAVLATLDEAPFERVLAKVRRRRWPAGAVLRRQGATASWLGVVARGEIAVVVEEESGMPHETATLGESAVFGQGTLLADVRARSTLRAKTEVEVLVLEGAGFREAIGAGQGAERGLALLRRADALRAVPELESLGSVRLARLIAGAKVVNLGEGERVASRELAGVALFYVQAGCVRVEREGVELAKLVAGDRHAALGASLASRAGADALVALEASTLFCIDEPSFAVELLGRASMPDMVEEAMARSVRGGALRSGK